LLRREPGRTGPIILIEPVKMQTDHRTDQGVNADVAESLDAVESALSGANRLQAGPMPVVMISGAMYPGEPSWTDSKGRAAGL
jgi:hypothetical protein